MNKYFNRNYSLYLGVCSVTVILFFTVFGPQLAPHSIFSALEVRYIDGEVVSPPLEPFESMIYPLGTDRWGYDLLSMILYGLRYTVWIAIAVAAIKMVLGTVIGMYIGTWKKTPSFIVAFESAWSYVPAFLILYFCLLPINYGTVLDSTILIAYFIVIASLVGIPSVISSVRQKTAEIYKKDFVLSSITLGAKRRRLLWRHIFPQLKESLLVMFTMEIVYVITIMGQLALLNIFVGGTIVRTDPVIYISMTKEVSGLVGQARDHLMGNQYILIVPLIILLVTTISFSLLTAGLKNKFQSDYARMPWIKTGIIPKGKPTRKRLGEKRFLQLTPHKIGLLVLCFFFIVGGILVYQYSDSKIGVTNENTADYRIDLSMVDGNIMKISEEVTVTNHSEDKWQALQFYPPQDFSQKDLDKVTVNEKELPFTIKEGVYYINLPTEWQGESEFDVVFNFATGADEEIATFVDWYFALAPYRNGKWSEATDENPFVEQHHALFSSYALTYNLPPEQTFISTGIEKDKQQITVDEEQTFSFSIVPSDWVANEQETAKGTNIRLIEQTSQRTGALEDVITIIDYFEESIANLPYEQLDILITSKGKSQTLPGMLIVNEEEFEPSFLLANQVAALYYQSHISSDPNYDRWIGSSLSYLAAYQYSIEQGLDSKQQALSFMQNEIQEMGAQVSGRQLANNHINEVEHSAVLNALPASKMIEIIDEHYGYKGMSPEDVGEKYLADFYEQFAGREVDSETFLQFTRDYFNVPSGAFNRWLNTEASRE